MAEADQRLAFAALDGSARSAQVHLPAGSPPFRTALFLPGLQLPGRPRGPAYVARLAGELCGRGLAVVRTRGQWHEPGGTPLEQLDWQGEVDDGCAALDVVKDQRWSDARRLYLVGLSLGGVYAPVVAARGGVAGIVSWGATARPWPRYAADNLRRQLTWKVALLQTVAELVGLRRRWHDQLVTTELDGPALFAREPGLTEVGVDETGCQGRPLAFWRQLCRFDPVSAYQGLACPVVALRGAADCACHPEDQQSLVQAAEAAGLQAHAATLPGLDHGLRAAPSPAESCRNGGQGEPQSDVLATAIVASLDELERR